MTQVFGTHRFTERVPRPVSDQRLNLCSRHSDAVGVPELSASKFFQGNRAAAHGGSLHVVCARPKVRQLFRLTGLDRRLPPARTLDQALGVLMAARDTPACGARRQPVPQARPPGAVAP